MNEPMEAQKFQWHVLVSHALTAYASSLAGVLRHIRPQLDVRVVAPGDLECALSMLPGAVVVSDVISPAIRQKSSGWILYYPDQQNLAVAKVDGDERAMENPSLDDVLLALDRSTGIAPNARPNDFVPNTQLG